MSTTSSRNFTTLYSGAGSVVPQGAYGNANVVSLLSVGTDGANTVGNISATGNITANYFIGNLVGNIVGNIAAPGANTEIIFNKSGALGTDNDFTFSSITDTLSVPVISASGNITTDLYFLGNGSQLTGLPATYSNAQVSSYLASGTNTANIITTGNIAGSYFLGNGSQLTGLPEIYGNANVSAYLASGTNTANIITTANVVGAFLTTSGASGNIFGANYIVGNYFVGDGSLLSNVASSYGNANVATFLASFGSNTISTTGNVSTGNVIVPNGSRYRGDFTAGVTAGRTFFQTTDTNTSASTFLSAIPGPNHTATPGTIGTATGLFSTNDTGNASIFGMYAYPTDSAIRSLATGTGNINDVTFKFGFLGTLGATITQGGNITAVANLSSTQQTVIGTANAGSTGNIVVSGRNIATDMAYQPDGQTSPALYYGRTMVGTGFNGNINLGTSSRLASWDSITRSSTATQVRQIDAETQVSLTGNVTNASFRQQGIGARVRVGGGPSANTVAMPNSTGTPTALVALQPNMDIGNSSPYNLGNTTVSHVALNGGFITVNSGSTVGNAYGFIPGAVGPVSNYIGLTNNLNAAIVTGNLYMVYNPSSATLTTTGLATSNSARAATNYYFLRNDDDVAQVKLGSLRSYNEFQYATATSGTVNIDKTNAQVQYIAPTANVTIGDFQNFVTNANDGTNNDAQTDTVTLIIKQGATPYTITMPTGNAAIKYANNVTTVGSTASAVTMISITGANVSGAALYLVTISPEFV